MTFYVKKTIYFSLSKPYTIFILALILMGCTDQKDKTKDHLSKSAEYINKGELEKARIELKTLSKSANENAETYFYMALLNEKKRQFKEMKENLLKTVELAPSFVEARIKLGKVQLLFGDIADVMKHADYVLKDDSQNIEALILKASALIKQKNSNEAFNIIDEVLKTHPNNTDALTLKSLIFMEKGDFGQALTLIESAKKTDVNNISLDFFKIQIDAKKEDTDAVIEDYKNLIRTYPDNNEFKVTLAKIYTQKGKKLEAEALLQTILDTEPNNIQSILMYLDFTASINKETLIDKYTQFSEIHKDQPRILLSLASWMIARKNFDEATTNLNHVIKIEKNSNVGLSAKVELAKIALETNKIEEAKKISEDILASNSSYDDANILKARILLIQGKSDESITYLNKVIWSKENSEEAQLLLAQIYLMKGDMKKANVHFSNTLLENPANIKAVLYVYEQALANNDLKVAKEIIVRALNLSPSNILFLEKLANINIMESDWINAKATVQKITNVSSPLAYDLASYLLGQIHQGEGNYNKAIEIYNEILKRLPENSVILTNIAQCYENLNNRKELIVFLINFRTKYPQNITAGILLAENYLDNKNIDAANNLLQNMIKDKLINPHVYYLFSNVKLAMNNSQGAVDIYLDGLKNYPDNITLSTSLANLYVTLANYDAAVAIYDALLKKNETLEIANNNLAVILAENYSSVDKLSRAGNLAEKFKDSTQPYYKDTYAWVLIKQGNFIDGLNVLTKLILSKPNIPIFRYHLGIAYHEMGNNTLAINEIKQAIALSNKTYATFDIKSAEMLLADIIDKTRGHSLAAK